MPRACALLDDALGVHREAAQPVAARARSCRTRRGRRVRAPDRDAAIRAVRSRQPSAVVTSGTSALQPQQAPRPGAGDADPRGPAGLAVSRTAIASTERSSLRSIAHLACGRECIASASVGTGSRPSTRSRRTSTRSRSATRPGARRWSAAGSRRGSRRARRRASYGRRSRGGARPGRSPVRRSPACSRDRAPCHRGARWPGAVLLAVGHDLSMGPHPPRGRAQDGSAGTVHAGFVPDPPAGTARNTPRPPAVTCRTIFNQIGWSRSTRRQSCSSASSASAT